MRRDVFFSLDGLWRRHFIYSIGLLLLFVFSPLWR